MEVWDTDMRTEHMKMMMRHNEMSPAGLQVMLLCFLCCSLTDRWRWAQQHQSDAPNRFYQRSTPTGGDVLSSGRGRLQTSRCSFSFLLVTWKLKIILLLGQKINNCVFVVSRRKPEKRSDKSAQILSKEEVALWVNITFRFMSSTCLLLKLLKLKGPVCKKNWFLSLPTQPTVVLYIRDAAQWDVHYPQ